MQNVKVHQCLQCNVKLTSKIHVLFVLLIDENKNKQNIAIWQEITPSSIKLKRIVPRRDSRSTLTNG